jgi:hypothetical protein
MNLAAEAQRAAAAPLPQMLLGALEWKNGT